MDKSKGVRTRQQTLHQVVNMDPAKLMREMEALLDNKLEPVHKTLSEIQEKYESTLNDIKEKVSNVEEKNETLTNEAKELKVALADEQQKSKYLNTELFDLKRKVIYNEQHDRKRSIRIFGLSDEKPDLCHEKGYTPLEMKLGRKTSPSNTFY